MPMNETDDDGRRIISGGQLSSAATATDRWSQTHYWTGVRTEAHRTPVSSKRMCSRVRGQMPVSSELSAELRSAAIHAAC